MFSYSLSSLFYCDSSCPFELNHTLSTPTTAILSMHFRRGSLAPFGSTLPDEVVTTAELEQRLDPLHRRLRLPEGRLELMTGIRERRFFPAGTRPSGVSIESAQKAIAASGIDARYFGAL